MSSGVTRGLSQGEKNLA